MTQIHSIHLISYTSAWAHSNQADAHGFSAELLKCYSIDVDINVNSSENISQVKSRQCQNIVHVCVKCATLQCGQYTQTLISCCLCLRYVPTHTSTSSKFIVFIKNKMQANKFNQTSDNCFFSSCCWCERKTPWMIYIRFILVLMINLVILKSKHYGNKPLHWHKPYQF